MTILFAGGEDCDFTPVGLNSSCGPVLGSKYRPFMARYALQLSPSTKNGSQYQLKNAFSAGTFWFSAQVWNTSNGYNTSNDLVQFLDSSNAVRLAIRNTSSGPSGPFEACTVNGSTYTQIGSNFSANFNAGPSTPDRLDVYVVYSTSGTFTAYINGSQVFTYSGDITASSGLTALAGFALGSQTYGIASSSYATAFSEIVVATTDTRNMSVATLYPVAIGNTSQWTANQLATMAAVPVSGSPMTSATVNQVQEYAIASPLSGAYSVAAVVVSSQANCGLAGPQNAQLMVRTGSTDYNSSSMSLANTYGWIGNVWATNPNTSSAWAMSQLTSNICTWDAEISTYTESNISFSTDQLTMTVSGVATAIGTQPQTSGQWYFEITASAAVSNGGMGICNYNFPPGTTSAPGITAYAMHYQDNGAVVVNDNIVSSIATYSNGSVIGVAVDLINNVIYFRVGSGNWNNSGSANPATNTGGISISSLIGGPGNAILPVAGGVGPTYVANFGATSFAHTAPSGFSAWGGSSVSSTLNIGIESIT